MTISIKSPTSTTGSIQLNGNDVLTIDSSGNLTAPNNLTITGNVSTSGTIPAANLTGTLPAIDGSSLTNLPQPAALTTASGSAPSYSARAWVTFGGGTTTAGTVYASGNVSSVTDSNTGRAVINFTTAMPNADYAVAGMCTGYSGYNSTLMVIRSGDASGNQQPAAKNVNSISVAFGHSNTVVNEHVGYLTLVVFG